MKTQLSNQKHLTTQHFIFHLKSSLNIKLLYQILFHTEGKEKLLTAIPKTVF